MEREPVRFTKARASGGRSNRVEVAHSLLDLLLRIAHVLLRDLPRRPHRRLVRGEVLAVLPDLATVEFGDVVHPVRQRPVVADRQQAPVPLVEHRVQPAARFEIQRP
jgi:hypothetical protein